MQFPERFSGLPAYTFTRLRDLLAGVEPGGPVVAMSIGEPQHAFPPWVGEVIAAHAGEFRRYPPNDGTPELLHACAAWLARRYGAAVDAERRILALNGTREGLYNAALALCPERKGGERPAVLIPNPFYQAYAAAALAAGAEPVYVPATRDSGFLPDFAGLPEAVLKRTALAYLCSPSNPQGAVASRAYLAGLLELAERFDFRLLADECYGEIYRGAPPPGALEAARDAGADPERVLVFHSLSKRSNLAGLRSGFVAGGAASIARMKRLRAYAGAPLPMPLMRVAERAWADEDHVDENRRLYAEKFAAAGRILSDLPGVEMPPAGFFLWLPVADGETAALRLWREAGLKVLPGAYLGRGEGADNPGHGFVRAALVGPQIEIERGLQRLRECLY